MADKKQLELKIAAGTLVIVKNEAGKAECFTQSKIGLLAEFNNQSKIEKGYVACFHCKTVFTYNPVSGCNHLTRHTMKCNTSGQATSTSTESGSQLTRYLSTALSKKQVDRLLEACSAFVAIDLQAFKFVEGQGTISYFSKRV